MAWIGTCKQTKKSLSYKYKTKDLDISIKIKSWNIQNILTRPFKDKCLKFEIAIIFFCLNWSYICGKPLYLKKKNNNNNALSFIL